MSKHIVNNVPQGVGSEGLSKAETVWCVRGMPPTQAVLYRTANTARRFPCQVFTRLPQLLDDAIEHMSAYPDGSLCLVGMTKAEEDEAIAYEKRTGVPVLYGWRKLSWVLG